MTILGKHTINEARDLLAVADYRFKETFRAFDALTIKPADLTTDVGNLARKWRDERLTIAADLLALTLKSFPVPADLVSADDDYNKILSFIHGGEWTKGTLQDITHRIEKLSGKQILYPNQPKQNSSDVDIEIFKDLDSAIKQGEAASAAASKKVGEIAENKWPWIIGGTIAATLVGVAYLKK